jgi:hypothetical protein
MNEIKWNKFVESTKNNDISRKFVDSINKLLTESKDNKPCDDLLYEIDGLLLEMTEEDQREAQELLNTTLNEIEPYQKIMKKEHPRWKMRLIGHGKNKDKSSPYKFKPSMKRHKSAPPAG